MLSISLKNTHIVLSSNSSSSELFGGQSFLCLWHVLFVVQCHACSRNHNPRNTSW